MTTEDTVFATARLTLGLSRLSARSHPPLPHQPSAVHTDDVLDRRKRKRDDQTQNSRDGTLNVRDWLMEDVILTPGSTPLPRPLSVDPPLLAHRYLPISVAGDGAFSRTIFARDTFDPKAPIVAIKAMKPGFEVIGRQEYKLLRRIQNLPMPKHTCLPIVNATASFFASSTYHLVLEALEPGQLSLPHCQHSPMCNTTASCSVRQAALRKVAVQLLLGLSVLHDQMGYIHADLKPENILRCRGGSASSMKLKLIDLGNALPINRTNIYYDDFEVQSIHYRAPEVLLGLPFTSSIDIFSLGLILAQLLLAQPDHPPPPTSTTRDRLPSFPTSPPQSNSPQPLYNLPLLSTVTSNRRAFVNQMISLFGPLPQVYRRGKFWSDEYVTGSLPQHGTLLAQRLDNEGVDSELIDFIMRMLNLDPEKRISARDALKHEWLVGPLLGYWAVVGVEWKAVDNQEQGSERPADTPKQEIGESRTSTPEMRESPAVERRLPPIYDFSTMEDEEDDNEEVSFVYAGSSPTKPIPFKEPQIPMELEEQDDDEVLLL